MGDMVDEHTAADVVRVRLRMRGRVQGVFFRAATRDVARELGLSGWVRNRDDGTVEAEAQGERRDVERLAAFLADGPEDAEVTGVERTDLPATGSESGFAVR